MTSTTTYIYDTSGYSVTNGNLITKKIDNNSDGIPESVITYNLIYSRSDYYGDGPFDNRSSYVTYVYNADGKLISSSSDGNSDGIADSIQSYTYNGNGDLTSYTQDDYNDGVFEYVSTSTYDLRGNLISVTDKSGNQVTNYTYDNKDNLLTVSNDYDGDGTVDEVFSNTYDANSRLTSNLYPGVFSSATYDANGSLTSSSLYNSGGSTDSTYTYDINGRLATQRTEQVYRYGFSVTTSTYRYDSEGNLIAVNSVVDINNSAFGTNSGSYIINTESIYRYDDDGRANASKYST